MPAEPQAWEAGRAQIRSQGTDVALLGVGRTVPMCETAAEILAAQGISASVVNSRWVKPLDFEMVSWAASQHRLVVTVEDNTSMGGFGGAVCEALADLGLLTPVLRMAIPDCFVTHGAMSKLLSDVGLTAESIAAAASGRLDDIPPAADAAQGDSVVAEAKARDAEPYRRHPR
jgi:1-deoxy-D-xylulose-5-phosphate synthase